MSEAAASSASKLQIVTARFSKGEQPTPKSDDGSEAGDKWKARRAAINRRTTAVNNAPSHVQAKWQAIVDLGPRQNKTRLQQ